MFYQKILDKNLYLSGFLTIGALTFIVLFSQSSSNSQSFKPIEDFILFGSEGVEINQDSQSLSGDIGSDKEIKIAENSKIIGNLFSQRIKLAENVEIDGNVTSQELEQTPTTKILGITSKEITFPISQIPDIPDFETGNQDIEITQKDYILNQGNYRDITIKPNASLILAGNYNLRSLRVEENGVILFDNPTTTNIKDSFRLEKNTIITPKLPTLSAKEIKINFIGTETIHIGNRSILGFRLIAPNTKVEIGEEVLLRGSVWAREVKIGEKLTISIKDALIQESDLNKIITDSQGNQLIANEIILIVKETAILAEIQDVISIVGGTIKGLIPIPFMIQVEISTATLDELNIVINRIRNLQKDFILFVIPNTVPDIVE